LFKNDKIHPVLEKNFGYFFQILTDPGKASSFFRKLVVICRLTQYINLFPAFVVLASQNYRVAT
jgi:hypothetical protein